MLHPLQSALLNVFVSNSVQRSIVLCCAVKQTVVKNVKL